MKILGWYFLVMGSGGGTFVGMMMVARCANSNIRAPWVNVASPPYLIVELQIQTYMTGLAPI